MEQAVRAYPIEVEKALEAWIAENGRQGIWVSPAGWWYAGWKHGCAELEAARAERDEARKEARDFREMFEASDAAATRDGLRAQARIAAQEKVIERIRDLAERPVCLCGRPTGTAAIKRCAQAALDAAEKPEDVPHA